MFKTTLNEIFNACLRRPFHWKRWLERGVNVAPCSAGCEENFRGDPGDLQRRRG